MQVSEETVIPRCCPRFWNMECLVGRDAADANPRLPLFGMRNGGWVGFRRTLVMIVGR